LALPQTVAPTRPIGRQIRRNNPRIITRQQLKHRYDSFNGVSFSSGVKIDSTATVQVVPGLRRAKQVRVGTTGGVTRRPGSQAFQLNQMGHIEMEKLMDST
jgi:hypothetical protein